MLELDTVHCGDACEVLAGFPDGCFDLCVADIPYGISAPERIRVRGNGRGKWSPETNGDLGAEDRQASWGWVPQLARVLRPGGSAQVFCGRDQLGLVRAVCRRAGLVVKNAWFFVKTTPPPTPRNNFCSAVEQGWWFVKPGVTATWNGGHHCPNWFQGAHLSGNYATGTRIHPMQKPEWLLDEFMRLWTNPGDLVLDLFAGSATTSVCALKADCRFVAVEKDPEHCEKARRRIAAARRALQPQLMEAPGA